MNTQISDFLSKERIGVVSVVLPDGTVHAATVHFSHTENPFKLYIQTSNSTLKVKPFLSGATEKAAFVVGFSEEEWITIQLHGTMRAVTDQNELEAIYTSHYKKQPQAEQYKGPKTVFLEFTPTWWRFTDFNTEPETILMSE